jgi:hypothetical protein
MLLVPLKIAVINAMDAALSEGGELTATYHRPEIKMAARVKPKQKKRT